MAPLHTRRPLPPILGAWSRGHYWLPSALECGGVQASWANITRVGLVASSRVGGGAVAREQRVFLTSLACGASRFAPAVREHGGGENALQWGLDVSVRAEDCRQPVPLGLAGQGVSNTI